MNTSLVIIKIHINSLDCILSASSSVMPMLACGRDTLQHLMLLADSSPPNQDPHAALFAWRLICPTVRCTQQQEQGCVEVNSLLMQLVAYRALQPQLLA